MAAKPPAPAAPAAPEAAAAKPKSKKLLILIVGAVVLLLVLAAAAFFLLQPKGAEEGAQDPAQAQAEASAMAEPPTFLPLESMVVNLADPGVTRFAQLVITLQLADTATSDRVTAFMPALRAGILRLASQRSAEQLLTPDGKDALAAEILALIRQTTGLPEVNGVSPVQAVLFTSLIVQ